LSRYIREKFVPTSRCRAHFAKLTVAQRNCFVYQRYF